MRCVVLLRVAGASAGSSAAATSAAAVQLGIRGSGSLLLYCSVPPAACVLDGGEVEAEYSAQDGSLLLRIPKQAGLQHSVVLIF
jgi:Raffinose synthase or seed imbibition protein Sip1